MTDPDQYTGTFASESQPPASQSGQAALLKDEISRQFRQQEMLTEFSKRALSGDSLENLFQEALKYVTDLLGVRFAKVIERLAGEGVQLRFRAVFGFSEDLLGESFDPGSEPHAAYTLESYVPVVVENIYHDQRIQPSSLHHQYGIVSGVTVVIYGNERPFGVLQADHTDERAYSDSEVAFMQSIANILGIAIERKQAESDAIGAEERYREVLEGSNDGLYEWNIQTNTVFWSDRYYNMLGLEPGEIDPNFENFLELVHPDDRERVAAEIQIHLGLTEKYVMDYRIRHKQGHYLHITCRGHTRFDPRGAAIRMSGLVRDISAEKKAEQAIKESENRFRLMADSAPALIWMSDSEGKGTYVNQTWLDFTGRSLEQELGYGWLDGVHPDDLAYCQRACNEAKLELKELNMEFRFRRADGEYRWMVDTARPRFTPDGEFVGYIGSMFDITDRKASEESLQAQYNLNQIIMNNATAALFMADANGHCTYMNETAEKMTGYTLPDVKGQPMHNLVHYKRADGSPYPIEECPVTRALQNREVVANVEDVLIHRDGTIIPAFYSASPIIKQGKLTGAVVEIRDISAKKQARESLKRSLERERLTRRVLEMISQPGDLEVVLKQLADEVGSFFQADRCFVMNYSEDDQGFHVNLVGQYCPDPELAEVSIADLPPKMLAMMTKNLKAEHAIRMINTPTPEAYLNDLETRINEILPGEEARRQGMEFVKTLMFDRYKVESNLRVGISYYGRPYGAITLHQCKYQRHWTNEEIELLQTIAGHIGMAMYQTELFHHEQEARMALQKSNELLGIISSAQSLFITNENINAFFEDPLNRLLLHTESEYGFIGEVLEDEEGRPYLKCNFLTNIAWDEETNRLYKESLATGFEFHNLDNLFGHVITTGGVVISNDPQNDPRSAGRPKGHPALNAFLGMPIQKDGTLLGMVGIANRPGGYSEENARELQPFLDACANIIQGHRSETLRKQLTHDLKVSERALKIYASKLERSNQELDRFATIASHDLQAPLRKVIMFSDFLKSSATEVSPEALDYIDRIQKATARMQSLITDLLSLSRVHRKGQPFKPVQLELLVKETVADLEEMIHASQGTVNTGPMPRIEADPTQIRQLLLNLIGNGLKFYRPGVPPVVDVAAEIDGETCELRISDNGIGFDEKYLDRIFSVFERLHGESEYEGTGIGLAICQKIVERHGGTITATSRIGEGSTFIVRLPLRQSA